MKDPMKDPAEYIARAREMYTKHDDIEIDDEPKVSIGDHGKWIAAWVFVDDAEVSQAT